MNCQEFITIAPALARNHPLDEAGRAEGLKHAESCVPCETKLAEERALLTGVRAVVLALAQETAPARVEETVLAAFRAQFATSTAPAVTSISVPKSGRIWRRPSWKIAAAAGILLLLSGIAVAWRSSRLIKPRSGARVISPTPSRSPGPSSPSEPAVGPAGRDLTEIARESLKPRKRGRRPAFPAPANRADDAEMVTQFFPLREGESLATLDSLRMVRVELPGSALGEVGLPVDPETAKTPVKADVLLGDDGLARAIRFVR